MRLIDGDELKKKSSKMMFEKATGFGSFDAVGVLDIDAAPTIDQETLRPTAEWISVKDRLPKVRFIVLAYEAPTNDISLAFREKSSEKFVDCGSNYYLNTVTHWMPLPKPPEEPND